MLAVIFLQFLEFCLSGGPGLIVLLTHGCFWFLLGCFWLSGGLSELEELRFRYLWSGCREGQGREDEAVKLSCIFCWFCCAGRWSSLIFITLRAKEHDWVPSHQDWAFRYWHLFRLVFDSRPKHWGFVAIQRR